MGLLSCSSLGPRLQLYTLPRADTRTRKGSLLFSSSIFLSPNSSFPSVMHGYWHPEFKEINPYNLQIHSELSWGKKKKKTGKWPNWEIDYNKNEGRGEIFWKKKGSSMHYSTCNIISLVSVVCFNNLRGIYFQGNYRNIY